MKTTRMLLPRGFKTAGICLLIIGVVLGVLYCIVPEAVEFSWNDIRELFGASRIPVQNELFGGYSAEYDLSITVISLLMVVAGVFIGFSRNKEEDEFIEQIRFESLILSVYLNSIILVVCLFWVWGLKFLPVMFCSLFSVLYIFIICFYIRMLINKKTMRNEE